MKAHRIIWLIASVAVMGAVALAAMRQGWLQFHRNTWGEDLLGEAIVRLETDPAAWEWETQSAVRAAAVAVESKAIHSAQGYYVLAMQYQREHNVAAAESLFKRAIAVEPDWAWAYVGLGNLLGRFTVGRTAEAVEALRKAILLRPDWARPHNILAVVLRLENRLDEAEQEALEAIRLDPEDVASHNNYANLLIAQGKFEAAEEHYRLASTLDPASPKPYYNLACLYSIEGRTEDALAYLQEAIDRAPTLRQDARDDPDLALLRTLPAFQRLVHQEGPPIPEPPVWQENTGPLAPAGGMEQEFR